MIHEIPRAYIDDRILGWEPVVHLPSILFRVGVVIFFCYVLETQTRLINCGASRRISAWSHVLVGLFYTSVSPISLPTCNLLSLLSQSQSTLNFSREDWLNLLSIATKFEFDEIKDRAIRELEVCYPFLDPVTKLELAGRYEILQWYQPTYKLLCNRPLALSQAEEHQLGYALSKRIRKARRSQNLPVSSEPHDIHVPLSRL